jgi:3-deoxy-D-manno-octulosonate 8-phosphate phosphatase KdsC-like HAD superfamily phosphatase
MTRAKSIIKKTGDQVVDTGVIVKGVINVAPEDQLQAQFDMANIVLVSKGKMEKWRKDQDKLKQEMED